MKYDEYGKWVGLTHQITQYMSRGNKSVRYSVCDSKQGFIGIFLI